MFCCEFCEISHNIFFVSEGSFSINTLYVYCLTLTFCFFKNDVTHIFWLSVFFGLICRLGTRVSSIFQALSQRPIFNPVEYQRLSFFYAKIVCGLKPLNIFPKKLHRDVRSGSKYASVSGVATKSSH